MTKTSDTTVSPISEQEYYLFQGVEGSDSFAAVLPRTPEIDAYLFNHHRRKADETLVTQLANMMESANDEAGLILSEGGEPIEEMIRNTLNMNRSRKRYGRTASTSNTTLLHDKVGAIANFAFYANNDGGRICIQINGMVQQIDSFSRFFEYGVYNLPQSAIL